MQKQTISQEERFALYNKLVAGHPGAVMKGDSIPYTSLNGHMYSYLSKDDFVALRLGKDDRETFIEKYKTTLALSYGIIQKEYIVVPDSLLKKTSELKPYFNLSYEYVSLLKPKPTSRSKKKR